MNAEQKKSASHEISNWEKRLQLPCSATHRRPHGALLQELVDARRRHYQLLIRVKLVVRLEPFGYFKG